MHLKILLAIVALGVASAQERPACESSCGNLNITFPFGTGEGCYYSSDFLVTCDRSSGEPIPYFGKNTTDIVISNISASKSDVEIMMFVGRDCYSSSSSLRLRDVRISAKNKFVAIGCDTDAYFEGIRGNELDG
ncbi:putative wall-associated receptor kinase, galacturonan-binding domain-containing protein [Helianthus anomalus]